MFFRKTITRHCGEPPRKLSKECGVPPVVGGSLNCTETHQYDISVINIGSVRPDHVVQLFDAANEAASHELSKYAKMREIINNAEAEVRGVVCAVNPMCAVKGK